MIKTNPPYSERVYIIAEAGSNWRMGTIKRDLAMARSLINVAIESGADTVKFQTYKPESVYTANAGQSGYLSNAGIKEDIRDIFADLVNKSLDCTLAISLISRAGKSTVLLQWVMGYH